MYNSIMYKFHCILLCLILGLPAKSWSIDEAGVNAAMAEQQAACAKNPAMEWSATHNRCVGKQKVVENRKAAQACEGVTDVKEKEKCHMNIAEQASSLSSDPNSLHKGNTTGSMMMNGVAAAYTAINMISNMGKGGASSHCTSKKILGITSVAGLASDVYLKMKAKKKIKELEGKYKLDTTTGSSEAQVTALEYLKEEQQTVLEIAGMEKKRNLALMLGYGIAAGWAVYEMTAFGMNPDCAKPNTGKELEGKADLENTSLKPLTADELKIDTTVDKDILSKLPEVKVGQ